MADKKAEPLLPVELGSGKVKFARGIKAGRWVFATGLMAQDFVERHRAGRAGGTHAARRAPQAREGSRSASSRISTKCCKSAGTDHSNLVRTDQYYTTVNAVPPYQQVRREHLNGRIPPSTSIAQQGLLLPGADMNIQAMGIVPGPGFTVEHFRHKQLEGRPTSGYSAALTAGDFIFIPGITSLAVGDEPKRNGVAAAALMTEGTQWAGQPIKLETEFIITQRMVQSLALAGAKLEDVIHAQVYLTDREDYSAFNEAVVETLRRVEADARHHPVHRPRPRALRRQDRDQRHRGEARQRRHEAPHRRRRRDRVPQSAAGGEGRRPALHVRPDGDRPDGLVAGAASDPRQPQFSSPAEAQAECIIDNIEQALRGGRHVARTMSVRVLMFFTDIREFYPGLQGLGAPHRRPAAAVLRGRGALAAAGAGRDGADRGLGLRAVATGVIPGRE